MSSSHAKSFENVPSAGASHDHRPVAGILFLLLGTTLFPLQDVIIKGFSDLYAVHQIVFLRGLFAIPVVAAIAHFDGGIWPLRLGSVRLQLFRSATAFLSYMVYYMALATIGLAETAAITFSTPIFVTFFATFFLGERIGLMRWSAIIVGLIGVMTIVRPGAAVFEPAALLAPTAAVSYAISIIVTRKLGNTTNGGSMTMFTLGFFIVAGGIMGIVFSQISAVSPHPSLAFLFRPWVWPEPSHWMLFCAIGLISGVGFFALTQAYRLADASVVTPFEYTVLPWAVLWGYVFFDSLPDPYTWIGLALIVGSGLFIVLRETIRNSRIVRKKGLGVLRQR